MMRASVVKLANALQAAEEAYKRACEKQDKLFRLRSRLSEKLGSKLKVGVNIVGGKAYQIYESSGRRYVSVLGGFYS